MKFRLKTLNLIVSYVDKNTNQILIKLTRDFSCQDFLNYRKERNWKNYDFSAPNDRLIIILKEIKEFKNGYFDEEDLYNEENNEIY